MVHIGAAVHKAAALLCIFAMSCRNLLISAVDAGAEAHCSTRAYRTYWEQPMIDWLVENPSGQTGPMARWLQNRYFQYNISILPKYVITEGPRAILSY